VFLFADKHTVWVKFVLSYWCT